MGEHPLWASARQHQLPRAGRRPDALSHRGPRRPLHRRRRRLAGLCGTSGADRRGFLAGPVQRAAGNAPLPHGGSLPLWSGWEPGVPGRLDEQVKIRGYRIELGEIEVALSRRPGVREAVVLARRHETGDARLVAYVVPAAGTAVLGAGSLGGAARRPAPGDSRVHGAHGLRDPGGAAGDGQWQARSRRSARPAVERRQGVRGRAHSGRGGLLAAIWAHVLGVPRVGREDSFFALGGHSLLATRMVSRVRGKLGVELPLRTLFERPRLADLAEAVESARSAGERPGATGLRRVERTGPLPLSFAQARLWFLDQLSPGSAVYNIPSPLSLVGNLDARVLRGALTEVVRRHEALRTTFPSVDGEPRQAIAPAGPVPLPVSRPRSSPRGRPNLGSGLPHGAGCRVAVRSQRRAALPDGAAEARPRAARPAADPASHRLGRLVNGDPAARAGGPV